LDIIKVASSLPSDKLIPVTDIAARPSIMKFSLILP
jgi:hypothetical protein